MSRRGPRSCQAHLSARRTPPERASFPPRLAIRPLLSAIRPLVVGAAAGCKRGMRTSASTATMPTKLITLRSKTSAALAKLSSAPASIGPSRRAVLNCTELSAMACGSSSRGTSAGTSDCHAGVTVAQAAPSAKASAITTQGEARPRWAATASAAAKIIMTTWP